MPDKPGANVRAARARPGRAIPGMGGNRAPLAAGRNTPERLSQAASVREGMSASKAGSTGTVPYAEARRNYLEALKPGLVKGKGTRASVSAPAAARIPNRSTPERSSLARQLRSARRDADREGLAEARDASGKLRNRAVAAIKPSESVIKRVESAFAAQDRADGGRNFVRLRDLRGRLSDLPRPQVDAAIRALRLGGRFSLDSHEGLHGTLTRSQRRAGIREGRSLLAYIARR